MSAVLSRCSDGICRRDNAGTAGKLLAGTSQNP